MIITNAVPLQWIFPKAQPGTIFAGCGRLPTGLLGGHRRPAPPFFRRANRSFNLTRFVLITLGAASALALSRHNAGAQTFDPSLYSNLEWRMIGPFRAGRTVGATGVRQQPNVFYIGVNDGGVWKTNDYGRVWTPIFDDQPTGSIGDLAVAPSNPNVIYV